MLLELKHNVIVNFIKFVVDKLILCLMLNISNHFEKQSNYQRKYPPIVFCHWNFNQWNLLVTVTLIDTATQN